MLYLLNWRLWAALFVLSLAPIGYFKGSHDATKRAGLERAADIAQANIEARKMEQLRQRGVDESLRAAAARERGIALDAARARDGAIGLRGDLDAVQRSSAQSIDSANNALRTVSELFTSCTAAYIGVAQEADRATSEVKTLREAWPK